MIKVYYDELNNYTQFINLLKNFFRIKKDYFLYSGKDYNIFLPKKYWWQFTSKHIASVHYYSYRYFGITVDCQEYADLFRDLLEIWSDKPVDIVIRIRKKF